MTAFLEGLRVAVPGNARVMGALPAMQAVIKVEGQAEPLRRFWEQVSMRTNPRDPASPTFAEVVGTRDAGALMNPPHRPPLEIIEDLDIRAWWPTLSPESQENVWSHLDTLVAIAQAIHMLDPAIVEAAAGLAEDIADGIRMPDTQAQGATGGNWREAVDQDSVMAEVQRRIGGLFSLGGR